MRTGNPSDFKAQYIVRNKNKIMLQMANLASKPALIELKLKKRPNLQVSYDAGYKGTRWQKVKEDLYELGMMLPGNSTRSLYWNEVGIR